MIENTNAIVPVEKKLSLLRDQLDPDQRKRFDEKSAEIQNYVPRVAIFGQCGVGKSSLCNALFGATVAETSNIEACTREPGEYSLPLTEGGRALLLRDMPGLGESQERDKEYKELYKKELREADIVLWVLRADYRAYSSDEEFYKSIINPTGEECPIVFVLNFVDELHPEEDWNVEMNCPGTEQTINIRKKTSIVSKLFGIKEDRVCPISVVNGFGLMSLVDQVVTVLPNEKKYSFVREAQKETVSEKTAEKAASAWFDSMLTWVGNFFKDNKDLFLAIVEGIARRP